MAITNMEALREWKDDKRVNVKGQELAAIYHLLNRLENADEVIDMAKKGHWTGKQMSDYLAKVIGSSRTPAKAPQAIPLSPLIPSASPPMTPVAPAAGGLTRAEELRQRRSDRQAHVSGSAPSRKDKSAKPAKVKGKNPFLSLFAKKDGAEAPEAQTEKPAGGSKKKWLVIGGVVLLVVAIVAAVMYFGGGSSYSFSDPSLPPSRGGGQSNQGVNPTPESSPAPTIENPKPMDIRGQILTYGSFLLYGPLMLAQIIGILVSLGGDIKFRKQWTDGIVAIVMFTLTVFLPIPASVPVWLALLLLGLEVGFVVVVSVMGGRDFSPLAAYFLLVGLVGGLVYGKISAIQAIFPGMVYSPVLPLNQLSVLFVTANWTALAYPVTVYVVLLVGVAFSIYECVRPSEDKTSRIGTLIAGGVGLLFFGGFYLFIHLAPWISYVVGFSFAILTAGLSQNERVIQIVTMHWGVRSIFDGAMLVTSILILVQVAFAVLV